MSQELPEIGKRALEHAQKLGADEADVYLCIEKHASTKFVGGIFASRGGIKGLKGTFARIAEPWIKKKGVPMISTGTKAGVGVRAIKNKAVGFSSVSSIEDKTVLQAVEDAIKIAEIRPPDPNWTMLPEAAEPSGEGGVFDNRLDSMNVDEMLDMAAYMSVATGDFDKRITNTMSMISTLSTHFCIVNTRGIQASDKGTTLTAYVTAKAKSGTDEVSTGDVFYSRRLPSNFQSLVDSTSKAAIEALGRKPLPEKYAGPVLFDNTSWSELFSAVFTQGISALNVQENRSIYKGKIGKSVATETVSIVDDGRLDEGFGTTKIDDEGVPRRKVDVVKNGVLNGLLYDNYAAQREDIQSTGNASRRTSFGSTTYANQPIIMPSNLKFMPGNRTLDELVSELKNGVLVKGSLIGAGHSNEITGDFSVTAGTAFKVEGGSIVHPLKPCTVAGNLYQCLEHTLGMGNDVKCFGNIMVPSVVVDGVVIST